MTMVAPVCPISQTEFRLPQPMRTRLPGMPAATDLASLIRLVNLITDMLRSLTGALTVNNIYNPAAPPNTGGGTRAGNSKIGGNTHYSEYPDWKEIATDRVNGYVFHKASSGTDRTQRAYVSRTNAVRYQNVMQEDPDFFWRYVLNLDG
jgi:hypothetical protein